MSPGSTPLGGTRPAEQWLRTCLPVPPFSSQSGLPGFADLATPKVRRPPFWVTLLRSGRERRRAGQTKWPAHGRVLFGPHRSEQILLCAVFANNKSNWESGRINQSSHLDNRKFWQYFMPIFWHGCHFPELGCGLSRYHRSIPAQGPSGTSLAYSSRKAF